jgi:hypothetical protein
LSEPAVDAAVEEALAVAPPRSRARVHLLFGAAFSAVFGARGRDPLALAEEGLALATELGDQAAVNSMTFVLAHALHGTPDVARLLVVSRRLLQDSANLAPDLRRGMVGSEANARWVYGYALARLGDLPEFAANRVRLLHVATVEASRPLMAAIARQWVAMETMLTGPLGDAQAEIDATLEHVREDAMFVAGHLTLSAWLRILEGRFDEAAVLYDGLAAMLPDDASPQLVTHLQTPVAARDVETVRALLQSTPQPLTRVEADWTRSGTLYTLAGAAYVAKDVDLGRAVRDLLQPYDGQLLLNVISICPASAAHALALATAATGDVDAAVRHVDDAIEFEESVGAVVLAERSRALRAELVG